MTIDLRQLEKIDEQGWHTQYRAKQNFRIDIILKLNFVYKIDFKCLFFIQIGLAIYLFWSVWAITYKPK